MSIYIPTLSRYATLEKIMPAWLAQDRQIILVVDPKELEQHIEFRNAREWPRNLVGILPVREDGMGIGYKRKCIVNHAFREGLSSFIMADDDHKPRAGVDMLLKEAEKPGVLGVGAAIQIYGRFTGGKINELHGPILWPGGGGFQVFALNTEMAIACGNFDARLHTFGEDAELRRQGIARGISWRVHADVWCDAVGQRYSPGGFMAKYDGDLAARQAAERRCRELIHKRWPAYTSSPDKPPRMAWQAMSDRYIPGWRKQSALHGGQL